MKRVEGSCHCGEVGWVYEGPLQSTTACNCTVCRRYGALWAYGMLGEEIKFSGTTKFYKRGEGIEFHFCAHCGCVAYYIGTSRDEKGRQRVAVNLRMSADPESLADIPVARFDGLGSFNRLPADGRCVKNFWF